MDSVLQGAVADGVVPGAVALISVGGEVEFLEAYGFAELRTFDGNTLAEPVRMTTADVFDLASLTKVFATTYAMMLLVDRGDVDLEAAVNTYLPDFRGPSKDSITVTMLLRHTSGLAQWEPTYYHAANADDAYAHIRDLPLLFPVGKQRKYSDLGFQILGRIVEKVSGESLDAFAKSEMYAPLGLDHTGYRPTGAPAGARRFVATSHGNPFERRMVADDNFGYVCDEDPESFVGWRNRVLVGEVNDGNAYHAFGGAAGHAGLFAPADELRVLLDALVNRQPVRASHAVPSRDTIERFLTPDAHGGGLGWIMSADLLPVPAGALLPSGSFGHTGFTGTFALGIPARGVSVILLTNRQHLGVNADGRYNDLSELRRSVVGAVLEATHEDQ